MILLYFFSILFAFLYIFIITHLLTAWNEIEEWQCDEQFKPETQVSIIIPFRNESAHLKSSVEHVLHNQYPKKLFEVIAVNDHSSDDSVDQILSIGSSKVKIINLSDHPSQEGKKAAIAQGVQEASGKLIITLDADCTVGKKWLRTIVSYYEYNQKEMLVGMVSLEGNRNVLEYCQIMDTCGTMGLHAAGIHNSTHFLANGANFIFEKALFEKLQPHDQNKEFASGDDVFFVNQVAAIDPDKIGFLKAKPSVVHSSAIQNWSVLWQQRKRWAGKHSSYAKGIYKWMTASIWLLCFSIVLNILLIPITGGLSFFIVLSQLLIKGIMDYLFLQNMCTYFDRREVLRLFIPAFFVQTLYLFVIGIVAMTGSKYEWKGRKLQ